MNKAAVTTTLLLTALALGGCLGFHPQPLPGEPAKASFATHGEARLRYRDIGQGSPVVLIHGFASSLHVWDTVVPTLVKRHRVLSLDLKGFGWSNRPRGDYSPKAQADLVLAMMDKRGIERAALVAHSWGSSVALQLAMMAPERVSRIALYDAWVYSEQLPTFFLWARQPALGELLFGLFYDEQPAAKISEAFYDKTLVSEPFVERVEEQLARPGTKAAALAAVRGQRYEHVEANYASIAVPVLLLWGREDKVTTLQVGERLSKQLPQAELVVYPQCGHFPMIEAQAASTRRLASFLAREDPR